MSGNKPLALSLFLSVLPLRVNPSSMQARHKCGCEINNKEQELQLTPFPCNSHSACSHLRLTDWNGALYGVWSSQSLVYSKKMERKTKKKPWKSGLHMIQDPLEEGGVVKPSVCLHILFSGMAWMKHVAVLQHCVEQLSHFPLLLPNSLYHCWELKQQKFMVYT